MRAVVMREPGGPEVLIVEERPRPVPAGDEILLRVLAAGVNGADLLQRRGKYPAPPGVSAEILGLEAAGIIAEVGVRVSGWKVGDRVAALLAGGGYAEYVAVPAEQCLPWPRGFDAVSAAGVMETCCTVWSNVFEIGRLQKGETLLVHGGASGIGTTAIQLGAARGATVLATVGHEHKKQACLDLGAAHVIHYPSEDFVARVMEITREKGADVILDVVGGGYLGRNVEALARCGRLVIIATKGGAKGELDIPVMMRKQAIVTGSVLRSRSVAEKSRLVAEVGRHVWPVIEGGQVRPVIDGVFAFEQASKAHERMESGLHIGKIILSVEEVSSSGVVP
jgi:NADPH2:quinone reductase